MSSPPDESMDEATAPYSHASDNESETGPVRRLFPTFHNLPVRTIPKCLVSMQSAPIRAIPYPALPA